MLKTAKPADAETLGRPRPGGENITGPVSGDNAVAGEAAQADAPGPGAAETGDGKQKLIGARGDSPGGCSAATPRMRRLSSAPSGCG